LSRIIPGAISMIDQREAQGVKWEAGMVALEADLGAIGGEIRG
jgi:hypothetical protein